MPDASLARCRIEQGRVNQLREWYAELERRTDEVVETLQHEGVYMEAEDLDAADEAGNEEAYEIDREHHEVLAACLVGEWEQLEVLGHLTNPER